MTRDHRIDWKQNDEACFSMEGRVLALEGVVRHQAT